MKGKNFSIIFLIVLLITFILATVYFYINFYFKAGDVDETENNIYVGEEKINLISNVEPFLFTKENIKLVYEGGPSHWGSKTVTFSDINQTPNSKIVNLHVIDESDLRGEFPKKEWNQKWEVNSDGSLYIDDILMLKSPIVIGQKWSITDYVPVINSDKKYNATVKITSVENRLTDTNLEEKRVYTSLTIDDIKTVDGGIYTETRVFQSGLGLRELNVTEPTISDLTLGFWLYSSDPIE
ncbi:MAG: hypothetical protein PHD15_00090 [Clostridia bacterium]|nr:hypothetical protein [Clostridia bacterium]MDD4386151.1 hypothetical protein [Clostridia bacterium]